MSSKNIFSEAADILRARQVPDSVLRFNQAEAAGFDPDACAAERWTCHMLAGDFEKAWEESDKIAARGRPDPHRFWDERPLDGRQVLIRCLHGLGDTLHFIRYAPLVRQKAQSVTIEAQPALKTLLECSGLADEVITWGEREPAWNQQIEITELPRVFRTTLESIPSEIPYLSVPATGTVKQLRKTLDQIAGTLRVGIVWNASSYNPARSIPVQQIAGLFDVPGTRFFSLQAECDRSALEAWNGTAPSLYFEGRDVLDTAGVVTGMDLIITVDTMMAHLAGALARPVWTLLPYEGDWRWMIEREDSPWYPTMRIFRQKRCGDWAEVLERVRSELLRLLR